MYNGQQKTSVLSSPAYYIVLARTVNQDVLLFLVATQPNAKSKRTLEVDEGALNYKIMCRVSGNPPPEVKWYKDGKELESSMRGIAIKPYRG